MTRGLSRKTKEMLDYGLTSINSVDYKVSLRWVFYRLVQGLGLSKKDYSSFVRAASSARKKRHRGWHPSILADETRHIYNPNTGYSSLKNWVRAVKLGISCDLDKHLGQEYNALVCFEAKAMFEQFKKYTGPYYVPLVPFGGDASIPLKNDIAHLITDLSRKGKPVIVLYFGDLDPKGIQIPKSAFTDIRSWTSVDFEFIRVGLNSEHVSQYDIQENPMKPGDYQWEALNDEAASPLITSALDHYIDLKKIENIRNIEERAEAYLRTFLQEWDPRGLE